tara:strand:- start:393 stop:716 length:324 start_codon:yes stop_codon:yes gene_type:complete
MNKANVNKIRSVLTTAIRVEAKGNRQDTDHFLKQVKENVEALIKQNRQDAITEGLARIDLGEPKELAPTKALYIEAHGQKAWDKIKRIGKASELFRWNKYSQREVRP